MFINLSLLYRQRDFRLLFFGQFISLFGNMLTYVALPYQVYHLTHSSFAVGNIGLIQLIPLLSTALWGGALADKFDRRRLLLSAEFSLACASAVLLINSLLVHPTVWLIYLVAAYSSACSGLHRPTLEALAPQLIPREELSTLSALNNFKYGINMLAGPALAGLIIAKWNLPIIYFIDMLTFIASILAIFFIKTRFPKPESEDSIVDSIKEGIRYACSRQELLGTYAVDIVAMIFGMPMALFPAIAETMGGAKALGWLYAAPSIGMFFASFISGWTAKVQRQGMAVAISAVLWGVAIIFFGFTSNIYLAFVFLALAGSADALSGVFRMTMWNQTIPTHLRGRLAGVEMISYMTGPLLGNAEAGLVAAATNTKFSVVSGGILCVVAVFICVLFLPRFWRYHAKEFEMQQQIKAAK